jgi:hypothetical protein
MRMGKARGFSKEEIKELNLIRVFKGGNKITEFDK